jgi:hypothetical protein
LVDVIALKIYRWRAFANFYSILDEIKSTVQANYSSYLNNKSQKYNHHHCGQLEYYYEALKVAVNTSGYYMISSNSTLDTFGYLYTYPFDPYSFVDSSLDRSDNFYEDKQFTIIAHLQSNITYVLVITTSYKHMNIQGPFSVIVKGLDRINLKRMGMYVLSYNLSNSQEERKRHITEYFDAKYDEFENFLTILYFKRIERYIDSCNIPIQKFKQNSERNSKAK